MKTVIAIKTGKSHGIAYVESGVLKVCKNHSNLVDLKFLLMSLNRNNDALVFIEEVKIISLPSIGWQVKLVNKKMFRQYQEIKSILVHLNIPFVELSKKSWLDGQNLYEKLEEKEQKIKRLGNAAVHYFGGKVKVSRWNAYPLLILRFALLKIQTDKQWVNERIEEIK